MLTKTITYTDIDDNKQTATYCFRLTEAEATKNIMVNGKDGQTFQQRLERLGNMTEDDVNRGGGREIMDTFEEIIKASVGQRDGQLFRKSPEITDQFIFSGAYDAFFLEMLSTPDSGASIIRAILPAKVQKNFDEAAAKAKTPAAVEGQVLPASGTIEAVAQPAATGTDDEPTWLKESRYPTKAELMRMNAEETRLAMKMKSDKAFG